MALPTKFGQSLTVEADDSENIKWKSYNDLGKVWFEDEISIDDIKIHAHKSQSRNEISDRLIQILRAARELNSEFLINNHGYTVTTRQNFNRLWGLGTSSTLINNISNWAKVDAYQLLEKTFSGSGYDIACAQNDAPITFLLKSDCSKIVLPIDFNPKFKNQLYFVYLNQKQNSRDGIAAYRDLGKIDQTIINDISGITEGIIASKWLSEFNKLIDRHETIISRLIGQETVKSRLFNDYDGSVKSLGAWGGDFVVATSEVDPTSYFKSKGFKTILPFDEMILV